MAFNEKDFILRPRFTLQAPKSRLNIVKAFDLQKQQYYIKHISNHFYISIPKEQQKIWSPQLHIQIEEIANDTCAIHGVFGPNPRVWTFFIFLHFILGITFIACLIKGYVHWSLKQEYQYTLYGIYSCISIWIILYIIGRIGKEKAKKQMKKMYIFLLNSCEINA